MNQVSFTKMHGLGNDFVVFKGPMTITREQVAALCDRHMGVGADGLLIVSSMDIGVRMEYWNADGSDAEMCGNGLRCSIRFAVDNNLVMPGKFTVQTPAGPLNAVWDGIDPNTIEAQIGKAIVEDNSVSVCGLDFYKADVGNPHAVTIVDSTETAPVLTIGPDVEIDKEFPHKTNVEFAEVVDEHTVKMRVWERGSGETLACGTGMVATANVSTMLGKTTFPVRIIMPGGGAELWPDEDGFTRMKGPAAVVFEGEIELEGVS